MTLTNIQPKIDARIAADQPAVVVYGRPGCQQCRATTRKLDQLGVPHTYVDVDEDETAAAHVRAYFKPTLPAVEVHQGDGVTRWSGYLPDSLNALAVAA